MIQTNMPPPATPSFQYHPGDSGGSGSGSGSGPGPGSRPHFRGYTPVVYNGKPTMNQEEYDGKRLRKSSMRKTVDYNCSVMKYIEDRIWQRGAIDRPALQPDVLFYPELLPPAGSPDNPINAVTTRFVRTATNKMRCPIFCLSWTPEGRRLITGASSGEFTLWNGLTFNFETILQAHDSPVRTMIWSRNDQWMVTGDHGGYIKYWQMNMNNVKMFQAHKDPLRGISFSPSDHKLATCSDDGTVRIWDFNRCYEEKVLRGHGADVKCCDWHPYKGLVVSGSKDNQQPVRLWDPKTGQSLATLHAHKSTVMDLKFNRNGNWLITASRDHLIKLFDIRNLSQEVQIFRGHKKEAASLSWHPIHETLFSSGGSDGAMMFWNVGCDKEVGSIDQAHDSLIWSMSWHPLGHVLASGSNDHTTKFWTRNRPGDTMQDKYNLNIGEGTDGGPVPAGRQQSTSEDTATQQAEEGDASSAGGGGSDTPFIPGMGPEDRVEPPAAQKESEQPAGEEGATPPRPDAERGRFFPRRPHWRFASHWNERWLQQDSGPTEDRGGWRGGRNVFRGPGRGPGPFRPGDRDREDIKDDQPGDAALRDGQPQDMDDRDADMRPPGGDTDLDMRDRDRDMRDRDRDMRDRDRDMRGRGGRFGPGPGPRGRGMGRGWGRDDDRMPMETNGVHEGGGGPPGRGRGGDRGGFRGGFRGGDRGRFNGGDRGGFNGGERGGFNGGERGGFNGGERGGFNGGERGRFDGERRGLDEGERGGFNDSERGGFDGGDRGGERGGFNGGDRGGFNEGDRGGFNEGDRGRFNGIGRGGHGPRDLDHREEGRPGPPDGWRGRGGGGGPPQDNWRGRGGRGGGPPRDEGWRDSVPGGRGEGPPDDHWRDRDSGPPRDDGRSGSRGGPPPPDDGWRGRGGGRGGGPSDEGWRGGGRGRGVPPPPEDGWRGRGGGRGGGPPDDGWREGGRGDGGRPRDEDWRGGGRDPGPPLEDNWSGGMERGRGPPQQDDYKGGGRGGGMGRGGRPPPEDDWRGGGRGAGIGRGGGPPQDDGFRGGGPPQEDRWRGGRGGARGGAGFRGRGAGGFRDEERGGGWRGGDRGRSRGGRPPRGDFY